MYANPTSVCSDPTEIPKGGTSMRESLIRKRTVSHSSAPPSPSRGSRPPSPAMDISKPASGGVIPPPESSGPAPDIGAGMSNEGNVAPELEVHHVGADTSAPNIERDL